VEPTYWAHLTDFFGPSGNYSYITLSLQIASDHTPIIATISIHIIACKQPPKLHNGNTNLEVFRNQTEESLRLIIPLKTAEEIEEAIEKFNNIILNAVWSATPEDRPQCPEYSWEVKEQIKGVGGEDIRRRWQMSRYPADIHRYNEAIRKLKYQIKRNK
jgi:hypothetical protein